MYAVTWHVWQQLHRCFPKSEFRHIEFPRNRPGHLAHRLRRLIGLPNGPYFPFAASALARAADHVRRAVPDNSSALLFRSSTRWIACRPDRPYFVHLDAVFHTYLQNTARCGTFQEADVQRICTAEAEFLERANGVFFESAWALEKARVAYGLRGDHYSVVGVAGGLSAPSTIRAEPLPFRLLTIANHFHQKGGDLVYEAFRILKHTFPELSWDIVGGRPNLQVLRCRGVRYHGVLNPENSRDLANYQRLLTEAGLIVHPTREDMNPLVLLEAASFGCPAVSVHDFAIPELVKNEETGLLLRRPVTPETLANAICGLLTDPVRYQNMRTAARARAINEFCWNTIGQRMAALLSDKLDVTH